MNVYAVIDTNVLVSALLKWDSVPGAVLEQTLTGSIIPILNEGILEEYGEVLRRKKFSFKEADIQIVLEGMIRRGVFTDAAVLEEHLPDPKDTVFYVVTMEVRKKDDAYLVTGNIKHFPITPYVVTPREMLSVLERDLR